jgi:hypothetical protein
MKFRFLMSAMLAAAVFCAAPTWAARHGSADWQGAVSDSKTAKPASYNITLKLIESTSHTSAACTGGEGWADWCPSGGCNCYTYSGTASGAAGSGNATLYETYDYGDSWLNNLDEYCVVAFGDIEISGSKDTESLAFNGADCESDWGDKGILSGGAYLQDTNIFTDGAVGSFLGNYTYNSTTDTFKIKGTSLK